MPLMTLGEWYEREYNSPWSVDVLSDPQVMRKWAAYLEYQSVSADFVDIQQLQKLWERVDQAADKCKGTDPCRAAKPIVAMDFGVEPPSVHIDPKPKRSVNRHKPGYFTEYMRDYRKGIRRSKAKGINPDE